MTSKSFDELLLIEPLLRALEGEGYNSPTPIQEQAIPHLLSGKDVLGCAQTGTGKTAAFTLPMLQLLQESGKRPEKRAVRSLILTPTRELAVQIHDSVRTYGKHLPIRSAVVLGGVAMGPQVRALSRGVDVLIATPGRLLDLLQQKHVRLDSIEMLTLDEADRMLDMGFINDVKKIISLVPKSRQTLLFSATMPKEVATLAERLLRDPVQVGVAPVSSAAERVEQQMLFVEGGDKRDLLLEILAKPEVTRAIVFTRTKHRANRLAQQLSRARVKSEAVHGNKSQGARQRALRGFAAGKLRVLVATDVMARGIDVDEVSHVINYELPNEAESYVHRIGRTARAGQSGVAYSLCSRDELGFLRDIEKLLGEQIKVCREFSVLSESVQQQYQTRSTKPSSSRAKRGPRPSSSRGRRSFSGGGKSRAPANANQSRGRGKRPKRRTGARQSQRSAPSA